MGKSKKPSISSIARDGYKFSVSWKKGENYTSKQVLEYAVITKEKTFNKAAKKAKKDKKLAGLTFHKVSGVGKSTTKASFKLDADKYYPTAVNFPAIEGIEVRLAGQSKKESLSSYDYKTFDIDDPPKPGLSISYNGSQAANLAVINITVPNDSAHKSVIDVYYQYVIVDDYDGNPNNSSYWADTVYEVYAGTKKKSGSIEVPIDGTANNTLLCWAHTEGMAGDSDKVTAVHQFVEPYKPTNLELYGTEPVMVDRSANTTRVSVKWTASTGTYMDKSATAAKYQSNPIDQTTLQYYIGAPALNDTYTLVDTSSPLGNDVDYYTKDNSNQYHYVEEPNLTDLRAGRYYTHSFSYDVPLNASYQDGLNQIDTADEDFGVVVIPQVVDFDQCIWVRVVAKHDTHNIPSDPLLVYKGSLQKPTIGTITSSQSTYKATVTVTNNSTVSGSFVSLVYRDKVGSEDSGKIIGIVPSGESSAQVQCPNWDGKTPISFGAYAVYGTLDIKRVKETPVIGSYSLTQDSVIDPNKDYYAVDANTGLYIKVEDPVIANIGSYYEGVTLSNPMIEYAFNEAMRSDIVYKGGEVPVSPSGVKLESSVDNSSIPDGTIQVSWDVPWLEATGAEISWADHEDAWYSTNSPTTYELALIEEPKCNISGLETGKKWYVRVRLYKESGGNKTYSLPSAIKEKDLSMAPDIPELTISPDGIITRDTEITCSWVYITNDGTPQGYAEVDEVIDGVNHIIGKAETQQYISFRPSDEEINWESGSEHDLILIVRSESGQYSAESDKVHISIAEPITPEITETSLVKDNMEINVRTYDSTLDAPAEFNNPDDLKNITNLTVSLEPHQSGTPWQDTNLDVTPYLFRATPANAHTFNSEFDKLIGASVAVNQLAPELTVDNWTSISNQSSIASADGVMTVTSVTQSGTAQGICTPNNNIMKDGHIYYYCAKIKPTEAVSVKFSAGYFSDNVRTFNVNDTNNWTEYSGIIKRKVDSTLTNHKILLYTSVGGALSVGQSVQVKDFTVIDLTQMLGTAIADRAYTLESGTARAGIAWLKSYGFLTKSYYPYNTGALQSVKTSAHKMVGFNQWDEQWETGGISDTTGANISDSDKIRAKNYCKCVPNTTYYVTVASENAIRIIFYDDNQSFISETNNIYNNTFTTPAGATYFRLRGTNAYGTAYNNDICINLSDPAKNGTYEPYKTWQYALEDVELRGLYKLDANNNIYADGDIYDSIGTVTRKYSTVDMGELSWTYNGTFFQATTSDRALGSLNMICVPYVTGTQTGQGNITDKMITSGTGNNIIVVKDSAYTTAASLTTALDGVYLIYELATSTTESADPYQNPQTVDPYGTEEYEDTRDVPIPVGHETRYADIYPISGTTEVDSHLRGFNVWDEEWEVGAININTGEKANSNSQIRSKNYIKCLPNTVYRITVGTTLGYLKPFYYDVDKNFVGTINSTRNNTITTPNNAHYMRFHLNADYGTTYNNDICINISDPLKNGTYEPYASGTDTHTTTDGYFYDLEENKIPYLTKNTNVPFATHEDETVVGGTIAWNQIASLDISNWTVSNVTPTITGTNIHIVPTTDNSSVKAIKADVITNHVYFYSCKLQGDGTNEIRIGFFNSSSNGLLKADSTTASGYVEKSRMYKPTVGAYFAVRFQNATPTTASADSDKTQCIDLTQAFGTAIADRAYTLEQSVSGSGIRWLRSQGYLTEDYYAYDAESLQSVNTSGHKTRWFNQFNKATVTSGQYIKQNGTTATINTGFYSDYIKVVPNTAYYFNHIVGTSSLDYSVFEYDANKNLIGAYSAGSGGNASTGGKAYTYTTTGNAVFIRYNGALSALDVSCINVSDPKRNGEYEPYMYPLDPTLTLRGIPKLDSNNNIYYDGDTYESDGTVTRKYGVVDLGTLTWSYITNDGEPYFRTTEITTRKAGSLNLICTKYVTSAQTGTSNLGDKQIGGSGNSVYIFVRDTAYTAAAAFKTAMDGVYLIYELETPTEETALPYANPQELDDANKEEYFDYGVQSSTRDVAIPVGHTTKYKTNIVLNGKLDVVTGKLIVDYGVVNLGSLTWTLRQSSNRNIFFTDSILDLKPATSATEILNIFCTRYRTVKINDTWVNGDISFYSVGQKRVEVVDNSYLDASTFKASVANVPLVYELAEPIEYQLTASEIQAVVGKNYVWSEEGALTVRTNEFMENALLLKRLPLTLTVTGGGASGSAMVVIKRYDDYHIPRPDDDEYHGYDGDTVIESVCQKPDSEGNYSISISLEDLKNRGTQFDDGGKYRIETTVTDSQDDNGQIASIDTIPDLTDLTATPYSYFTVDWDHQAISPSIFTTESTVQILEDGVAAITIGIPDSSYLEGHPLDSVDLYRLSADEPVLIYKGAEFGETYIDPFPTIGKRGGYRIVYITDNGDYIDDDEIPAWTDYEGHVDSLFPIISFGNKDANYFFNVDSDNSWTKPFTLTHYLGGGIEGDWTAGAEGSGSIKSNVVDDLYPEEYKTIRELARYCNICHVRKLDGTNWAANVTVSDSNAYSSPAHLHSISLSITKVDNPAYDAMPLEIWEEAE